MKILYWVEFHFLNDFGIGTNPQLDIIQINKMINLYILIIKKQFYTFNYF